MKYSNIVKIASTVFIIMSIVSAICLLVVSDNMDLPLYPLFLCVCGSLVSTILFGWLGTRLREVLFIVDLGEKYMRVEEEYEEQINPFDVSDEERRANFLSICKQIGIDPMATIGKSKE